MPRTKTKLNIQRIKGVHFKIHPDLFKITENMRKELLKRGITPSQMKISQLLAKKLKRIRI